MFGLEEQRRRVQVSRRRGTPVSPLRSSASYSFSSSSSADLRPLLLSTELSSLMRPEGRKPPLPRAGLPWRTLETPAGGGSGGGWARLEGDGEGKRGWRRSM